MNQNRRNKVRDYLRGQTFIHSSPFVYFFFLPESPLQEQGKKKISLLFSQNAVLRVIVSLILACERWIPCYAEAIEKRYNGKSYTAYQVDLTRERLVLIARDHSGDRLNNAAALKSYGEKQGKRLIFATNAGIFRPSHVLPGLNIENRKLLVPLNIASGKGNFFMKPNGVFFLSGESGKIVSTAKYVPGSDIDYATQSGPMLVEENKINSLFDSHSRNQLIRSGVGMREHSKVIFAIANEPVSFYEFAVLFRDAFGCTSALYLDGVISEMYIPEIGREQKSGDFAAMFAIFDPMPVVESGHDRN